MSGEESDLNISDESDDEETIDVEESYETKVCGQYFYSTVWLLTGLI